MVRHPYTEYFVVYQLLLKLKEYLSIYETRKPISIKESNIFITEESKYF